MSPAESSTACEGAPMKRAKLRSLQRNAAVVLGDIGTADDIDALTRTLDDAEPLVREHAAWVARSAPEAFDETARGAAPCRARSPPRAPVPACLRLTTPSAAVRRLALRFGLALAVHLTLASRVPAQTVRTDNRASDHAAGTSAMRDSAERRRLERLETLADIWATLERYHPVLQIRTDIDWDRAFVRAVPRVEAARTAGEFVRALNEELFAPLSDPLSFARTQDEADRRDSSDVRGSGLVRRLAPGIAYLDARDPLALDPGYPRRVGAALRADSGQYGAPEVLVVDARWQRKQEYAPAAWLGLWTEHALGTGVSVSRLHRGHTTPTSWQVEPGDTLAPAERNAPEDALAPVRVPTVFLVNPSSLAALERPLDALQRLPRVAVALDASGPLAEWWGLLTYPELVRIRIQSPMLVSTDGALGGRVDTAVAGPVPVAALASFARGALRAAAARPPRPPFTFPWRELPRYAVDSAPLSRELRLLGLVRLWKEVGSFNAYLEYASDEWTRPHLLQRWIPRVEASAGARDYYRTLEELVAGLHDSHASVHHPLLDPPRYSIPAQVQRAGRRVLVTRIDSTIARGSLQVGDEVLAINGVPVRVVEDSVAIRRSAAHRGDVERDAWRGSLALRGSKDTPIRLTILGSAGRREVTLRRSLLLDGIWGRVEEADARRAGLVRRLAGNIGYIDLYRMRTAGQLDSALAALATTDGLVLDARIGGPRWAEADIRSNLVSRFVRGTVVEPKGGLTTTFMHGGPPVRAREEQAMTYVPYRTDSGVRYTKPLAVLIAATDQSYGEATLLPLKLAGRAIFVGERTAGTNGGAPDFSLPGGAYVVFTHERVTYPGGARYHGVGIAPDVPAFTTPSGLRAGRDDVLEAAATALRGSAGKR